MTEGLTYDTGALIAAERDDRLMWSVHRAALGRGIAPTVPAAVLAQAWRGGPQHRLSQLLAGCRVEALHEQGARAVGALSARSGHPDVVDVSVVEGALRRSDVVLTSDRGDLETVVSAIGEHLAIH